MNNYKLAAAFLMGSVLFASCVKEPDAVKPSTPTVSGKHLFIINEGAFGQGNASIDFYNIDSSKLYKSVFESVNKRPLGDVAQSMALFNGNGYIVVNNSNKVEVINDSTFASVGTITGFSSPRYFMGVSVTKAYVSDWFSDNIQIIDLANNAIIDTIKVGSGPETMLKVNNKVFVCNSGGFGVDSTISVINSDNDEVIATVKVGDAPLGIKQDANGKIWVLCRGAYGDFKTGLGQTKGKLVRINPDTYAVEASFEIGNMGDHPNRLTFDKEKTKMFYTLYSGVYRANIDMTTTPSTPFIVKNFYGLGLDENNNTLYGGDALDFGSSGIVFRYNAETGAAIDSFSVGVAPNGFLFN